MTAGRATLLRGAGAAVVALFVLSGCAELLPTARSEEASPFATFEAARAALERVEPYRTTLPEMKAYGLDPRASSNVREIPYPQLVSQLAESSTLVREDLDGGIRACIEARQRCRAYQFRFSRVLHERRGDFVLDLLNFYRVTHTSGWRIEAIVLVVDDSLVVFRNHAGEPRIDTVERVRNPLGPLQSFDVFLR